VWRRHRARPTHEGGRPAQRLRPRRCCCYTAAACIACYITARGCGVAEQAARSTQHSLHVGGGIAPPARQLRQQQQPTTAMDLPPGLGLGLLGLGGEAEQLSLGLNSLCRGGSAARLCARRDLHQQRPQLGAGLRAIAQPLQLYTRAHAHTHARAHARTRQQSAPPSASARNTTATSRHVAT
jgi:hypothetical protein